MFSRLCLRPWRPALSDNNLWSSPAFKHFRRYSQRYQTRNLICSITYTLYLTGVWRKTLTDLSGSLTKKIRTIKKPPNDWPGKALCWQLPAPGLISISSLTSLIAPLEHHAKSDSKASSFWMRRGPLRNLSIHLLDDDHYCIPLLSGSSSQWLQLPRDYRLTSSSLSSF